MHETNSSKLRVGRPSAGEEGNALLLAVFMHLPRAASAKPARLEGGLNRSGRTQGDGSSPRNGGYALPA